MADQDDSAEAIRELQAIGKRRWPGLTPHQQFARAMETNIDLANRAHKRRGPTMLFSEILIGLRGAFGLSAPQGNNGDVCVFAVAGSG